MEDIVERLRTQVTNRSQVAYDAAEEIESLRAQLAEVTKNLGVEKSTAEYFSGAHGVVLDQLLATQAHAARLVDALRLCSRVLSDLPSTNRGGTKTRKAFDTSIEALSTPINLDALHEDRARTLEEAASICVNQHDRALTSAGAARAIACEENILRLAATHRAKKEGK